MMRNPLLSNDSTKPYPEKKSSYCGDPLLVVYGNPADPLANNMLDTRCLPSYKLCPDSISQTKLWWCIWRWQEAPCLLHNLCLDSSKMLLSYKSYFQLNQLLQLP